jgi:hypothetical protein
VLSNLPYTEAATYNPGFRTLHSNSAVEAERGALIVISAGICWTDCAGCLCSPAVRDCSQFSILEEPKE